MPTIHTIHSVHPVHAIHAILRCSASVSVSLRFLASLVPRSRLLVLYALERHLLAPFRSLDRRPSGRRFVRSGSFIRRTRPIDRRSQRALGSALREIAVMARDPSLYPSRLASIRTSELLSELLTEVHQLFRQLLARHLPLTESSEPYRRARTRDRARLMQLKLRVDPRKRSDVPNGRSLSLHRSCLGCVFLELEGIFDQECVPHLPISSSLTSFRTRSSYRSSLGWKGNGGLAQSCENIASFGWPACQCVRRRTDLGRESRALGSGIGAKGWG